MFFNFSRGLFKEMNVKVALVFILAIKIIFASHKHSLPSLKDVFSPVDFFMDQYNSHKSHIGAIEKKDAINLFGKIASIVNKADEKLKVKQNSNNKESHQKKKFNRNKSLMRF